MPQTQSRHHDATEKGSTSCPLGAIKVPDNPHFGDELMQLLHLAVSPDNKTGDPEPRTVYLNFGAKLSFKDLSSG